MAIVGVKQLKSPDAPDNKDEKMKTTPKKPWNHEQQQVLVVPPSSEVDLGHQRRQKEQQARTRSSRVDDTQLEGRGDVEGEEEEEERDEMDDDETQQLMPPPLIHPGPHLMISKSTPEALFQKG